MRIEIPIPPPRGGDGDNMGRGATVSRVQKMAPDVWAALHPRTYSGAANWCPLNAPASVLTAACRRLKTHGAEPGMAGTVKFGAIVSAKLAARRVPVYHVGSHLADAADQTKPPQDVLWRDVPFPMDAGVLLFEIPNPARGGLAWIAWAKVAAGETLRVPGFWDEPMPMRAGFIMFMAGDCSEEIQSPLVIKTEESHTVAAVSVGEMKFEGEASAEDFPIADQITGRVASLFYAIASRPELVERDGQKVRTIKKGPAREEWTPNWVGRTYRVQRADGDGTHASPRLHWRRGHYRRQPCGTGRKEHKIIWLEPCLVGGETNG
jgi:hypothetical protein